MPMDALCLSAVLAETERNILGGRIDKIHQPSRDEILLHIRGKNGPCRLLLSANPSRARIQLTALPRENPAEPPMFCMLLRKYLSGGKGKDEPMSEAICMYVELPNLGIDGERIWTEDRAESTWENIRYSLDLIEARTGTRPTRLGVRSSEYHLFRASLFAKKNGVEFGGIPAKPSRLSQKINHFMREVAGVWHYILLGGNYRDQ